MDFITFCLIVAPIAALLLIFLEWWEIRHNPDEKLTLQNLLVGIGISICPIVQVLVVIGCVVYIFAEITPKIVLFKGEKS